MSRLAEYKRMLERYGEVIDAEPNSVEREEKRLALVPGMDRLWEGMSGAERQEALRYAGELYRRRVGG